MRDGPAAFAAAFGRPPAVTAHAPGRLNVIGEHTDYNGGLVLPVAIPQHTAVWLAPREDLLVRVASEAMGGGAVAEYRLGREERRGDWLDYVQGCTAALAREPRLRGFEAWITSDVPVGRGLSSSAALEVSLLRALRAGLGLELDDVALAMAGHRAEHDFVGARVGVMDQMASALADEHTALFLDAHTLDHERVELPAGLTLLAVDSGIAHRHASGGYNTRRAECEAAAARLGVPRLALLCPDDLARAAALPEPLGRRVRHVVTENARVRAAVAALRAGDLEGLGRLLLASHASQRDDFEVSTPEIDVLVEIAAAQPETYGARLTGGGFGGAVLVAVRAGTGPGAAAGIADAYRRRTGCDGRAIVGAAAP